MLCMENWKWKNWEKRENLRNRIDAKLVSNKKDYLKWTSTSSYMSHKVFDNDLVVKLKNSYINA